MRPKKPVFRTFFMAILASGPMVLPGVSVREAHAEPLLMNTQDSSRFIVAFELSEENGFTFTWPLEAMRPAPYEAVVMVVEKMPRVTDANGDDSGPMAASRHLEINGRRQKPYRIANKKAYFRVKLDQGRLRLSLSVPSGSSFDQQQNVAAIKLYQVKDDQNDPLSQMRRLAFVGGPVSEFFTGLFRTFHLMVA